RKDDFLVDIGNIYNLKGDYTEAEKIYNNVLKKKPDDIRALHNMGRLYLKSGKNEKAVEIFEKIMRLDSSHTRSAKALIPLYLQNKKYEKAISLSRRLRAANPNDTEFYSFEATALVRQENPDYKAAARLLRQALEKEPQNRTLISLLAELYLKTDQFDEAEDILKKFLKKDPDFAGAYRLLALSSLKQGNKPEALAYLEKELAVKSSPELYQMMGKLYLQTGQKEAGLNALGKALEEESISLKESELEGARGLLSFIEGDMENSEKKLADALQKSPEKIENRILLIVTLLNQQKYREAAAEAQKGLKISSEKKELLLVFLAQAYIGMAEIENAERTLNRALKENPDSNLARINLSAVCFHKKEFDRAQGYLEQIINKNPDHAQAKILLGRIFQAKSEFGKAEQILKEMANSNDLQTLIRNEMILLRINMKNYTAALQDAEKYIDLYPESADGYLLKSKVCTAMHRYAEALNALDEGLTKTGNDFAALAMAAHLSYATAQYARAISYLEQCKSEYGLHRPELKLLYAKSLLEDKQYEKAATYIENSLPKDNAESLYLLGMTWIGRGDLLKGEKYLEQAVKMDSKFDSAFYDLARVRLSKNDKEQAISLIKKAIEINPKTEKYYIALAMIYQHSEKPDMAIPVYEDGISKVHNATPLLNNLALLHLQSNNPQQAVSYANRALELSPNDPNVTDTMGQIYFHMKDFDKAISYFSKALEISPDSGLYDYRLGLACYKAGLLDDAKKNFESALAKNSKAPWASEIKKIISSFQK
ncbi:MAG: tetratricopeptide repeat protein, partial [Desulfococcaceae bacterium]